MASLDTTRLMVITIVQASDLPFPILRSKAFKLKAFVEIIAGNLRRRTESVKQIKNTCTWWDTQFVFPILGSPSQIAFIVLRDGILHDSCLGRFEITVEGLLERHQTEGDVVLSLADDRGNPSRGQLTIQITLPNTSVVASTVEQAQISTQLLSAPLLVNVCDDITHLASTVSNQQTLVKSFKSVMDKVGILVNVGDELAKIHPYVNFAWQVLSLGFKVSLA